MNFYQFNYEITWDDIKKFNYPNQKIGVIAHIENENQQILLQQRGMKSRDENGLFEDIGGKVESEDQSFKLAIEREIREEAGNEINITMSDSVGIYHCYKNGINWIFIIYICKYIGGKINIMEPDKCLCYKFFDYTEAINSDIVSDSCKYLIKELKQIKKI